MPSEYEDRKRLTFEQAEGAEPLPSQLKPREISPELRARLWQIFHQRLVDDSGAFIQVLKDWHVVRSFRPADEFIPKYQSCLIQMKPIFMEGDYLQVLGFVQWLLRHPAKPYELEIEVGNALRASRA